MEHESARFLARRTRNIGRLTLDQRDALETMLVDLRGQDKPAPVRMGYFPVHGEDGMMHLHAAIPVPAPEPRHPLHGMVRERLGLVPTPGMLTASLLENEHARNALKGYALRDHVLLGTHTEYLRPGWNGGRVLRRTPIVIGVDHSAIRSWERRNTATYLDRTFLPSRLYENPFHPLEDAAFSYS